MLLVINIPVGKQSTLNLGVLISGNGTNLQAIINATEGRTINASVAVVISDNPKAYGLKRAEKHNIPTFVVDRDKFSSRQEFEKEIVKLLREHDVNLVCLAGFMRIIGKTFLDAFAGRIINIHPALLPAFKGVDAQRLALEHGVKITGATVHFVDDKVDNGPIILQTAVPVKEDDTHESLKERILESEHEIYPLAIGLIADGKIEIVGRKVLHI